MPAIERAFAAVDAYGILVGRDELRDPIIFAAARSALHREKRVDTALLLAILAGRDFPWTWSPDGGPGSPLYDRCDEASIHWRPREAVLRDADPVAYSRRLVEPIAQVETLEFLAELAKRGGPPGEAAAPILDLFVPTTESLFARFVAADDPWRDLLALWELTRAPLLLERIWYLAMAVAYMYASRARKIGGAVMGTGDFEGETLRSASAALATVLWNMRIYPSLVPQLMQLCKEPVPSRGTSAGFAVAVEPGAWGDPGQSPDVMTTLVTADLLLSLDPDFDPAPTIDWLERHQEPDGWWRALGPEVPWLTVAVAELLERARLPFHDRFRWPGALRLDLDRRTQIPTFAWYSDLARALQNVPGLATIDWEVAFIDLAGFGDFNTMKGMQAGDTAITAFARALAKIPGTRCIRDGGDEFVVIGAPGSSDLFGRLTTFRTAWSKVALAEGFAYKGVPVRPRILVDTTKGHALADARDALGLEIGDYKKKHPNPPSDGVQDWSGAWR